MAIANIEDERVYKSYLTVFTGALYGSADCPVLGDLKEDLGLAKKTHVTEIRRCLRCNRTYIRVGRQNRASITAR